MIKKQLLRLILLIITLSILLLFKWFSYWHLFIALLVSHSFYFSPKKIFTNHEKINDIETKIRFNKFLFPIYFSTALNLSSDYLDRFVIKLFYEPTVFNNIYKFYDLQVLVVGSVFAIIYNQFFSTLQNKYSNYKNSIEYGFSLSKYLEVFLYLALLLIFNFYLIYHYSYMVDFLKINKIHFITLIFLIIWSFKLFFFDMLLLFEEKSKTILFVLIGINLLNYICFYLFRNSDNPETIFYCKLLIALIALTISKLNLKRIFKLQINFYLIFFVIVSILTLEFNYFSIFKSKSLLYLFDAILFIAINTFVIIQIKKSFKSI